MDAVIRSVPLSPHKARLGGAAPHPAAASAVASAKDEAAQAVERARLQREHERGQVEEGVRRQMADEASRLFDQERQRGLASGYDAGVEQARKEVESSAAALQARVEALLDAIDQRHRASLEQVRSLAVDVAFASVCRILGSHAVSVSAIVGCVTEQMAQLPHSGPVTIRLHPDDLRLLADLAPSRLALGDGPIALQADAVLTFGGCVIETDSGRYDASLETQLRRLKSLLDEHRAAARGAGHG
jgi:flagellar assembly protein FliH